MRIIDCIEKKRQGHSLSKEEIEFLLNNYLKGDAPDYQISAFLMAVVFQGMDDDELLHFTSTMSHSGEIISFQSPNRFVIDKHSTGGVGDKTSIALAPLLASLDMCVAKLSGRGLGHTGGTIDKFESISQFSFTDNVNDMHDLLTQTGIGLMGYTKGLVPLDGMLYALRDVTATVDSIPLIASSIMSKKLALETDGIVLDVKVGNGAFMENIDRAKELAKAMFTLGKNANRRIACILSNMNQPLGNAVGNSLEIIEAIETLKGKGPEDFTQLVLYLAGASLLLKDEVKDIEEGIAYAQKTIENKEKEMLAHLAKFIELSGGNPDVVYDYSLLPQAKNKKEILSDMDGYIAGFDTQQVGIAAMTIGAGRKTKEDIIDHSVGIILKKKQGDSIKKGELLAELFYNDDNSASQSAYDMLKDSIKISQTIVHAPKLILDFIH